MGAFETAVEFYRYREPYPAEFFETVAARLGLTGTKRLLDIACGPGNLAIGFAPFVGSLIALDPEPAMLGAARSAAVNAGVEITFIQTGIQNFDPHPASFDFVTVGRAQHWLPRDATLRVLEKAIAPGGVIAVCGSRTSDAPVNAWFRKYEEVRRAYASDPSESRYKIDMDAWFASSGFRRKDDIRIAYRHKLTIADLVGRALSFSVTSPAVLGDRRVEFEEKVRASLEPFAPDGSIEEEVNALATVFA